MMKMLYMNTLKQVGWKYKINTCTEVPLNSSEHCFCTCSLYRNSEMLQNGGAETEVQLGVAFSNFM